MLGAVQDMVISEIHGKQLLFVLHSDGILRVWDLSCNSKVFSHTMNVPKVAGNSHILPQILIYILCSLIYIFFSLALYLSIALTTKAKKSSSPLL